MKSEKEVGELNVLRIKILLLPDASKSKIIFSRSSAKFGDKFRVNLSMVRQISLIINDL